MKHLFWGLAVAAALVFSPSTYADKPDKAQVAKGKKVVAKGAAKGKKMAADAKAKGGEVAAEATDKVAVAKDKAKARAKSRKATMGAKAKAHRAKYSHSELKKEINHHARRMARLDRIGDLAEEKKNDGQIAAVQKLRKKEIERHEKWLSTHADAKHEDDQKEGKK